MSRPSGLPKTGGRKKGTPNLKTLVLRESLELVGFDIVKEMKELYPSLDHEMKAKLLLAFLPFLFPRPQAVNLHLLKTEKMVKDALASDPLASLFINPEIEK